MAEQSVRPDAIIPAAAPLPDADLGTHHVTNQVPPRADGDMLPMS